MRFGGAYVLWEDPLVLGCQGAGELDRVLRLKRPASVLFWPAWMWNVRNVPELLRVRWQAYRCDKSLYFMCNTPAENRLLRRWRFPGDLASINGFIDENLFKITGQDKRYDAVYTAQMLPFKRLNLAADIPSLFVVTYGDVKTATGAYDLHRFEPAVSHADFNRGWFTFEDIVAVLNSSRVGLSLSALEGAMLASVEYMLCGLPQISTPCQGGRELFFDDRYVAVVQPTAAAVADGVRSMIARDIDPQLVRRETLVKVNQQRLALCRHIQQVIKAAGGKVPAVEAILERFYGGQGGTIARFILLKDFESSGLV